MRVMSARVDGYVVTLKLSDGSCVDRDFSLVPAVGRIRRGNGLDRRVQVKRGALVWPGEVDFELDLVLWGWPKSGRRPLRRALIGAGGLLVPAPIVSSLE